MFGNSDGTESERKEYFVFQPSRHPRMYAVDSARFPDREHQSFERFSEARPLMVLEMRVGGLRPNVAYVQNVPEEHYRVLHKRFLDEKTAKRLDLTVFENVINLGYETARGVFLDGPKANFYEFMDEKGRSYLVPIDVMNLLVDGEKNEPFMETPRLLRLISRDCVTGKAEVIRIPSYDTEYRHSLLLHAIASVCKKPVPRVRA